MGGRWAGWGERGVTNEVFDESERGGLTVPKGKKLLEIQRTESFVKKEGAGGK